MIYLTKFKVQNFKCFDVIEVQEIGQFNLIVGDNNVGKTALMEAMMVDVDGWKTVGNLYHLLGERGVIYDMVNIKPYFDYLIPEGKNEFSFCATLAISENYEITGAELLKLEQNFVYDGQRIQLKSKINDVDAIIDERHFSHIPYTGMFHKEVVPYVGMKTLNGKELGEKFTKTCKNEVDTIEGLVASLKELLPGVKDLRIGENDLLSAAVSGSKKLKPLGSIGFGSNRFLEILIALYAFQGKSLFIDEIDTGIHHSRLREFLKTILNLAKELNVQLFMTTHSKECEEAFAQVIQDAKIEEDFRLIRLLRNEGNKVQASVHKAGSFIQGIDTYEFRNS